MKIYKTKRSSRVSASTKRSASRRISASEDPKFLYKVSWNYGFSETVAMDDETSDYQEIIDVLIDQLEAEGSEGCFISDSELDEYPEDEYVIGGNHGRALETHGILDIQPIGWEDVQASTKPRNKRDVKASTDLVIM